MTRDWKRLGRAIAEARKARGWSQQELADACSVGRSTIQAAEGGRAYTRMPASLSVVEQVLGWPKGTVEGILAGGDPPPPQSSRSPKPEETTPAERPQFAQGMPLRVADELTSGEVVETVVMDLSDDSRGVRLVAVLKADDARDVDPEKMAAALDRWVQAERKLRGLPTRDPSA